MLWTEINKTQPGGLRQPFPFISGHQNPSGSFANLDFSEVSTRQTAPENRITQKSPAVESRSLFSKANRAAAACEKLGSVWVRPHRAAFRRVDTSRHHPVPRPELPLSQREQRATKKCEGTQARLPLLISLAALSS